MQTRAVRLYGERDLRLDTYDLPPIKDDEILVKIITDSVCMSTYKLAQQGDRHTRTPSEPLAQHPIVIGHEMSGVIIEVGEKWKDKYAVGTKFTVEPDMDIINGEVRTAGYFYPYYGGDSTYSILPPEVMENDFLIPFAGDSFFAASLCEPSACILTGYNMMYHTTKQSHEHIMGVKKGGYAIVFGACGPMGLECLDQGLQNEDGSSMIVAVDVSEDRLARAEQVLRPRAGEKQLIFFNSTKSEDVVGDLLALTGGHGFDDAFVYAPVSALVEQADRLLAIDGCLNFFAGPVDKTLSASINFYNVHYRNTHMIGSSGSALSDMLQALRLMEENKIMPAVMVTHIGGLESAIDATLNLPSIPGGKKLIYTQLDIPLTAIADFREKGKEDPIFTELADSCDAHDGCWNAEAERLLLAHYNVDLTH